MPEGRLYVEGVDAALAAYNGLGVPVLLVECTPDVTKRTHPDLPSAHEQLVQKLEKASYKVRTVEVDTARVRSPMTGEVSAFHHTRTYVWAIRQGWRGHDTIHEAITPGSGELLLQDAHHLRLNIEPYYPCMPPEDQRDLSMLKKRKGARSLKGCLATVAEIAAYPDELSDKKRDRDMACGSFPQFVYDINAGLASTVTAAGGSRWIVRRLHGLVRVSLLTNLEIAAGMKVRGYEPEWLAADSEVGISALGNSIPQPVGDAWAQVLSSHSNPRSVPTSGVLDQPLHCPSPLPLVLGTLAGPGQAPRCACGKTAASHTSHTGKNPGRRFWRCPDRDACKAKGRVDAFSGGWTLRRER